MTRKSTKKTRKSTKKTRKSTKKTRKSTKKTRKSTKKTRKSTKKTNNVKDLILYNKVKKHIYKKYPIHSAYRSGILVKTYKEKFFKKHGNRNAYNGKKTYKKGLGRWFKENWRNQRGGEGYTKKGDVYRPTIKVTINTPLTFDELNPKEIKKAQKEKIKTGRVKRFSE
jgi:hypothetical protein